MPLVTLKMIIEAIQQ